MQNLSFHSQLRQNDMRTQAIYQNHWLLYMHLRYYDLLHNTYFIQVNICWRDRQHQVTVFAAPAIQPNLSLDTLISVTIRHVDAVQPESRKTL